MKKAITLTSEDIVRLLMEKTVQRDDLQIASNSSLLAILAILSEKMSKESTNERHCST